MFCIIGLGNPGEKYKNNRHNVGFQFIDYLIESLKNPNFKIQNAFLSRIYHLGSRILLVQPQTFMNRSGEAVKKIIRNWKLEIGNLVVIHDDLDIPLGKFKIQKGKGPQLHNGLESIEQHLKTKDFWRVRVGIDNRKKNDEKIYHLSNGRGKDDLANKWINGETYVLEDFTEDEKKLLFNQIFPEIYKRISSKQRPW